MIDTYLAKADSRSAMAKIVIMLTKHCTTVTGKDHKHPRALSGSKGHKGKSCGAKNGAQVDTIEEGCTSTRLVIATGMNAVIIAVVFSAPSQRGKVWRRWLKR